MNKDIMILYMILGDEFYLAMVNQNKITWPESGRDDDLAYCAGGEL